MEAKALLDFIEDQHVGNTPSTWDGLAGELDISVALEALSLGVNPSLEASDIHCRYFLSFSPTPCRSEHANILLATR